MELIQLNRDPRLNEFSKEDFVLNTVTGDLFAKTNTKLFKIASRNTNTELSTDTVLSLLPPTTDKKEIKSAPQKTIKTDLIEYKETTITKENSGSFLIPTTFLGKTYYNLDLSKIQAMFVRLDDEFLHPIGFITPPTINERAHTIYIESAHSTGHHISNTGASSFVETKVDSGDLVADSFTTRTIGGTTYPSTFKIDNGCRAMLVRSKFDWKIQSLSDFTGVTASFGHIKGTIDSSTSNINLDGGSF